MTNSAQLKARLVHTHQGPVMRAKVQAGKLQPTSNMTRYEVQYSLPVDNPVNNVVKTVKKGFIRFEVPINHPDAHNLGFQDLLAAAELSGLLGLPAHLNNKTGS